MDLLTDSLLPHELPLLVQAVRIAAVHVLGDSFLAN
jgi:hypothetical protein